MSSRISKECLDLARAQYGVISRKQAVNCGVSPDVIDRLLGAGHWRPLHRGVYAITTGDPAREAMLWAALRRAGAGAVLSHETAAELFKLIDEPSSLIHVTIPEHRRVSPADGLVVHRSTRLATAAHPSLQPPRTRLEETVLDLVSQAATFYPAFDLACAACQRRLTKPDLLVAAMNRRARLRWRAELIKALDEVGAGVHSALEHRYLHKVEQPHGLPTAERQARLDSGGRHRYLDNLYRKYSLCVELDGQKAHPAERRWQDQQRTNAITESGIATLQYNWDDVDRRACAVAAQTAVVLGQRGWPGPARPCGPTCQVTRLTAS